MSTLPTTPRGKRERKRDPAQITNDINSYIDSFSRKWELQIRRRSLTDSPINRKALLSSEADKLGDAIVSQIKYLYFKDEDSFAGAQESFEREAHKIYSNWVYKVNAEGGVIPEKRRNKAISLELDERIRMLECLLSILSAASNETRSRVGTPSFSRFYDSNNSVKSGPRSQQRSMPNDTPIPMAITPTSKFEGKRPLEPFPDVNLNSSCKKVRDSSPVRKESTMPPPPFSKPKLQQTRQERNRVLSAAKKSFETSFDTNVSEIFTQNDMAFSTQETEPSIGSPIKSRRESLRRANPLDSFMDGGGSQTQNSENWGSSLNAEDLEELDRGLEASILETKKKTLHNLFEQAFPTLPSCLSAAPIFVIYEIMRVFLFAQVSLSDFTTPYVKAWEDHDTLWTFLKTLPVLKDKRLPERCGRDVWGAALNGFKSENRGVLLSATLRVTKPGTESLFSLQLHPMRLDNSHRLGRRFGNDRFFELEVPDLEGRRLPEVIKEIGLDGWRTFIRWLVDGDHQLFGREWKPFFEKLKDDRKKPHAMMSEPDDSDTSKPYRIILFAVDGRGFRKWPPRFNDETVRVKMTVAELLECIRPTSENSHQPYMKLFARTALVLSRNHATVTIERSQIRYSKDIMNGKEIMTDGAGKISYNLAWQVAKRLGLTYVPSAFQGRFGEAKGMWIVDPRDQSKDDWIELYESQCKWNYGSDLTEESNHECHRTLEVVEVSSPLSSAALNTQLLPILMHQARSPRAMKKSISKILKEGMEKEKENVINAMENPQKLRAWVSLTKSSLDSRLKTRNITYRAGLPAKSDERLTTFLDAGFNPKELLYMKQLAKSTFDNRCEDLKEKMNITVGKSTYVYMIPDFWGVLEPNEIYLDLSGFVDKVSGLSNPLLDNVEVLVARNPAHYASDIQKVKAVTKLELVGLRDVIVFPTKGSPSLAAKLSGGDYDGDKAWVCWDIDIVENFCNSNVPEVPDLVKKKFIDKDSTTYAELTAGKSDPTATFLRHSFEFNMHQSMLGIATSFKDNVAYKVRDLHRPELVFLSTLLSNLVDQSKQGFIFTENHMKEVRACIVRSIGPVFKPSYKSRQIPDNPDYILDILVQEADKTVQKMKVDFHKAIEDPPKFDADLAKLYRRLECLEGDEWKTLLTDLNNDLKEKVQLPWSRYYNKNRKPTKDPSEADSIPDFGPICDECFEAFHAIKPHNDTPLTEFLVNGSSSDPEYSQWTLLKASALYALYQKKPQERSQSIVSNLVWWMAGKQYSHLKASEIGGMVPVTPSMYVAMKMNPSFVRQLQNGQHDPASRDVDVDMEIDSEGVADGEESDDMMVEE